MPSTIKKQQLNTSVASNAFSGENESILKVRAVLSAGNPNETPAQDLPNSFPVQKINSEMSYIPGNASSNGDLLSPHIFSN